MFGIIRVNGERLTITQAIGRLQHENARLRAELGLARSDAREWKDRYDYLEARTKAGVG